MVSDIKVGHTTRKCGFGLQRKNPPKSLLLARIRIPRFSGKNIMSFNTLQQFATKWRSFIYNLDLRGYTGPEREQRKFISCPQKLLSWF